LSKEELTTAPRKTRATVKGAGLTPKQQSEMQRMINSEMRRVVEPKVCYVDLFSTGISFSGFVISLTRTLVAGDGALSECTGLKILPVKLNVRFNMSTTQSYSKMRVVIFQWLDQGVPNATDVLAGVGNSLAPLSPTNWINRSKIVVLHDQLNVLFPRTSGTSAAKSFAITMGGMKPLYFYPGNYVNPQMNGLYLCVVSDDGVAAFPEFEFSSELIFTDA